ncbi:MAG: hypothetical protein ABW128_15570 [Rhizorhabdus sp.]
MPRASMRTPELVEEVLARMSAGEPLANICRDEHMPSATTWRVWCREDESLDIAHAHARDEGFDAIAADALNIIDAEPERVITISGEGESSSERIDAAAVQWAKNRAEMRLKLLAKWDFKRYGDKMDLTSNGESMAPQREPRYGLVDGDRTDD